MPRKPRFYMPGVPVHVVQRGHNREPVFFHDGDYHAYLRWAQEGATAHGCQIHAYVLMTNHIHLLVTPEHKDAMKNRIREQLFLIWSAANIANHTLSLSADHKEVNPARLPYSDL